MKAALRKALNPKVLIPTLLSAAFLAFILAFANSGAVIGEIKQAVTQAVIPAFFLTLLYLVAKAVQWRIYLARLNINPGWEDFLVPYAGGEIGNNLPMGVFIENYLLKGSLGSGFGRSAASTTWILITELIVCLLTLVVIGVPGWPWVRPVAAFLIFGLLVVGFVLFRTRLAREGLAKWEPRQKWAQAIREGIKQFVEGSDRLFSWHTFVYGLPLAALYLGAYATILYVVGTVLVPSGQAWSWPEAAAAYAFSLVVVLLVPVLPHLGAVEASGLGVLLEFGVSRNIAVGTFLSLRLLSTGTIILVCGLLLLVLHREVGKIFRRLSRQQQRAVQGQDQPEQDEQSVEDAEEQQGAEQQEAGAPSS